MSLAIHVTSLMRQLGLYRYYLICLLELDLEVCYPMFIGNSLLTQLIAFVQKIFILLKNQF